MCINIFVLDFCDWLDWTANTVTTDWTELQSTVTTDPAPL